MPTSLQRSRTRLTLDHPWLASLVLRLRLEARDEPPDGVVAMGLPWTAATDGEALLYNPAWIETLTQAEADGLYAHEAGHCGLLHHERRNGRDPLRWNVATDISLNEWLRDAGLTLPPHACVPEAFGLPGGELAEEVYPKLPQHIQTPPQWGYVIAGQGTPEQKEAQRAGWKAALADAMTAATQAGIAKGSLWDRLVTATLAPQLDWRALLAEFLDKRLAHSGDYTYSRLSRAGRALGLVLPSLHDERLRSVAIVYDTSGSIDARDLGQFHEATRGLLETLAPERCVVVCADADVQTVTDLDEADPADVARVRHGGGGGTDFGPAIAWADAHGPFDVVLYFTDLCGAFPKAPAWADSVLWLATTTERAPWGRTVRVEARAAGEPA